jgi:S-adenosylmethionine:tRNA ribosyltransferase-isomerase
MRVDTFAYELPPELIAQRPADDPESARLLVVDGDGLEERTIAQLPSLLPERALVVFNDTRVVPTRLLGQKADTGGRVEVFLLRQVGTRSLEVAGGGAVDAEIWQALGRSSKPLRFGSDIQVDSLVVHLLGRSAGDGLLEVALYTRTRESPRDVVKRVGHVPLPPYIKRDDDASDVARYQTIFARVDGAVAAPTAGLHFSPALLGRLAVRGCEVASITLHVGLGTFQPVSTEDLDDHAMHKEWFEVPRTTAQAIARARADGAPVIAVGTTVVRALESAADPERRGEVVPTQGETDLLIQPGYHFKVVDRVLTNFHLPRSTLLALTCAFGGTSNVLGAYEHAVQHKFRFFSYGDAMLLSHRDP